MPLFPVFEPCQHFGILGEHPLRRCVQQTMRRNIEVRTMLRRYFGRSRSGLPSRYAAGEWVQVLGKESIQRTLDAESRHRGLLFLPYMWAFCGGVYRVQHVMRSMIDEEGVFRAISRTVLLEGIHCGCDPSGCGRCCPLMWRDEWLKPASTPACSSDGSGPEGRMVRIRPADEIRASLNKEGKRDGVMFMPEMYQWTGQRFRVARQMDEVFEHGVYVTPRRPVYILEGLHCSGVVLGSRGRCDRRCAIQWHEDWLARDGDAV